MPGKSHRARAKHSARSKKKHGASAIVAQPRVVTEKPVCPTMPALSPSLPTSKATSAGARYHPMAAELRRIVILAGIMIAILVILALVLP